MARARCFMVSCTTRELDAEVREGRFRADLLHRLRVVSLQVPPLRDRQEDLPELLSVLFRELMSDAPVVEKGALERLSRQAWPGNVREPRNVVSRLSLEKPARITGRDVERALSGAERSTHFPLDFQNGEPLPALKDRLEREYLLHHFHRLAGDTGALRRFLRLGPRQLYRRLARLGISLREEKEKFAGG